MFHPWRRLRSLSAWTVVWTDALPVGVQAECDWHEQTILMRPALLQAERRSVLAHELQHVTRGPFPAYLRAREEAQVSQAAARDLISLEALGEALAWATSVAEVADELWVDQATVRTRLAHLHPTERHYLRRRLEHHHDG